jgi:hypothetical protein
MQEKTEAHPKKKNKVRMGGKKRSASEDHRARTFGCDFFSLIFFFSPFPEIIVGDVQSVVGVQVAFDVIIGELQLEMLGFADGVCVVVVNNFSILEVILYPFFDDFIGKLPDSELLQKWGNFLVSLHDAEIDFIFIQVFLLPLVDVKTFEAVGK